MGGSSPTEGRVEIDPNRDGQWGTICDDDWDDKDAVVVCRELGFNTGGTAIPQAAFGKGSGQILLDDVDCSGEETSIRDCRNANNTGSNCVHEEDAGVRCNGKIRDFFTYILQKKKLRRRLSVKVHDCTTSCNVEIMQEHHLKILR